MDWLNIAKTGADIIKGISETSSSLKGAKSADDKPISPASDTPKYQKIYSDSMEAFIETLIQDGNIDDDEMVILRKKAEKEGYDPDEVEIVVRKRLKQFANKVQAADPYYGMNPAQKLAKMIGETGSSSNTKSKGEGIMSGIMDMVSSGTGMPIGALLEMENEEEQQQQKISNIITSYRLPDNLSDIEEIAEVLINYMEPDLCRSEKRTKEDAKDEYEQIKNSPDLNAAYNKLNKIRNHPSASSQLKERITSFLEPPVAKKRFGLFFL